MIVNINGTDIVYNNITINKEYLMSKSVSLTIPKNMDTPSINVLDPMIVYYSENVMSTAYNKKLLTVITNITEYKSEYAITARDIFTLLSWQTVTDKHYGSIDSVILNLLKDSHYFENENAFININNVNITNESEIIVTKDDITYSSQTILNALKDVFKLADKSHYVYLNTDLTGISPITASISISILEDPIYGGEIFEEDVSYYRIKKDYINYGTNVAVGINDGTMIYPAKKSNTRIYKELVLPYQTNIDSAIDILKKYYENIQNNFMHTIFVDFVNPNVILKVGHKYTLYIGNNKYEAILHKKSINKTKISCQFNSIPYKVKLTY